MNDLIASVAKLSPKPGDIIVVKAKGTLSARQKCELREGAERVLSLNGATVAVTDDTTDLSLSEGPTGVSWMLPTFTADELVQFREEWERQFMRVRPLYEGVGVCQLPPEVRLVGFSRGDECDEPAVVGGK